MGKDTSSRYQFRRIGASTTLKTVKDVIRLDKEVVTIGRNINSDLFLDSAILTNFISRRQAEVVCQSGEYILRDYSMNGSYVNDFRVSDKRTLCEGDVIKFGHTQGKNIQKNAFAPQSMGEFSFIFERVPSEDSEDSVLRREDNRHDSNKATPLKSILRKADSTVHEWPNIPVKDESNKENKAYSTSSIKNILNDAKTLNMSDTLPMENSIVADSQDGIDGDSSQSSPVQEISCQISTHLKRNNLNSPHINGEGVATSPLIPVIGRNRETPTEFVKGYQPRRLMQSTPEGTPVLNFATSSVGILPLKFSTDPNSPRDHGRNERVLENDDDLADLAAHAVNHFDSDEDVFDAEVTAAKKPASNKSNDATDAMSPQNLLKQLQANLNSIENKLSSHNLSSPESRGSPAASSANSQGSTRQTSNANFVPFCVKQSGIAVQEIENKEHSGRKHSEISSLHAKEASSGSLQNLAGLVPQQENTAGLESLSTTLSSPNAEKWNKAPSAQSTLDKLWSPKPISASASEPEQLTDIDVEVITPDLEEVPKTSNRNKRKSNQSFETVVEKKTPKPQTLTRSVQKVSKRKSTPSSARAKKKSGSFSSGKSSKSKKKVRKQAEEDPRYDYECDSFDCCKPDDPLISWVQCDDCDMWYHTSCVGCRYEQVLDEHTEFHCGCR